MPSFIYQFSFSKSTSLISYIPRCGDVSSLRIVGVASNPFDLFGISFIKAKPFSVRKIQNHFTEENFSFYPSPILKEHVGFVQ